ncbi:MAG: hypothetical protein KDA20_06410 [Phycisphaerales bacterium]|nr:hypothetical protein [Phycisphaerales bacterium]
MTTFRVKNGLVGGAALVATELGREFYRPYIYEHKLHDFGIADTLGNSLGTVATVFIILAIVGRNTLWDYKFMGILVGGLCVYELLQGPMGGAIDPKDIAATLVAGAFCAGLYWKMHGRQRESALMRH